MSENTLNKFDGTHILLGLTASVAIYKGIELARLFIKEGASVRVVMTPAATKLVSPLLLESLTGEPVGDDMFARAKNMDIRHISWARWADIFLVAPATANTIAKMAQGFADNLLTTIALAAECPILVAPAMNRSMWHHPATQTNIKTLTERNVGIVQPDNGYLACGETGDGRFPELTSIVDAVFYRLGEQTLAGKSVLVTTGATREHLDPVRFITNGSTGTFGYEIARECRRAGALVKIISGHTELTAPYGVERVVVESAEEMFAAVKDAYPKCDIFISSAAVADFAPPRAQHKIKKTGAGLTIEFEPTTDILDWASKHKKAQILVGFAMETDNLIDNAKSKLEQKGLDLIIANTVADGEGFGAGLTSVYILDNRGNDSRFERAPKWWIARQIVEMIAAKETK